MAATAEIARLRTPDFDWDLAEAQFSKPINYERPPAQEVYGRSLSTIHRLGTVAVEMSAVIASHSPEADQAKVEFYTSVEEGFGTDQELGGGLEVRDFDARSVIDGRVMAADLKTPVSDMTAAGLICGLEKNKTDRHFAPQLIRTKWDHHNALMVDKMVQGETDYNTRIIVSPFPEEATARSGDAYWRNIGYVPDLRRGFVQLYHAGETFTSGSLSFDGSNKAQIIQTFASYNIAIPTDETTDDYLQHAITGTFSIEQAKTLALELADRLGDANYKKNH